jgi:hypothetical protein
MSEMGGAGRGAGDTGRADDALTIWAISVVAAALANVLHEGVGHAAVALATGTPSGVLSTVAWSSAVDSRLVAAGGTLVNLAAGLVFWWALVRAARGSARSGGSVGVDTRLFLWASMAFNLFTGTGYFFFSGVTNFGDWAAVIAGLEPHWAWRTGLVIVGAGAYYGAIMAVGIGLVRYVGVELGEARGAGAAKNAKEASRRMWRLTLIPYFTAIVLLTVAGLLNPLGMQLVWESALPSTAGADCGLIWMKYYVPKRTVPEVKVEEVRRSWGWVGAAAVVAGVFIFVLGRGIALKR